MSYLYGVKAEEIDEFWPQIRHLVEKPLVRTGAIKDFAPEDVLNFIKNREMQCWVAHEEGKILAVGVTQVLVYPQRKVLGMPFVGAESNTIKAWLEHFATFEEFARSMDCECIRFWGRKGWERLFKPTDSRIEFDIEV